MTLPPYPTKTYHVNFWFGFDPKTNDYKVVLYTLEFRLPNIIKPSIFPNCLQVEVYSLRKGSWEFVTQRFPLHVTLNNAEDQDCIDGENGHIHWLYYYDHMSFEMIVEFDLGLQTFREISLPDSIMDINNYLWNVLGVLAGKLCVMSSSILTN
uniref:F-box associated beta-propeller type 3 domain-containing protein n=1 Tax=Tanacetum cinerariifolium TaxID=118510 RepID=A0A699HAJ0_TANCI|nr:hypothetical protein [Tanacetum cinerariifolium]